MGFTCGMWSKQRPLLGWEGLSIYTYVGEPLYVPNLCMDAYQCRNGKSCKLFHCDELEGLHLDLDIYDRCVVALSFHPNVLSQVLLESENQEASYEDKAFWKGTAYSYCNGSKDASWANFKRSILGQERGRKVANDDVPRLCKDQYSCHHHRSSSHRCLIDHLDDFGLLRLADDMIEKSLLACQYHP